MINHCACSSTAAAGCRNQCWTSCKRRTGSITLY